MSANKEGSVCQRYHMRGNRFGDYDEVPDDDGEWVKAADYEALRAEVERLREANMHYQLAMNTAAVDELWARIAAETSRAEAAEARVAKLVKFVSHTRELAFYSVNEGIRPECHHMRDLAWKADAALNDQGQGSSEAPK